MSDTVRQETRDTTTQRTASPDASPGVVADTRGVQWTLEAFLAVLLLFAALVVVTAVLPVGTQQAENEVDQAQLQMAGDDVLRLAERDGLLTETLLYWNTSSTRFADTDEMVSGQHLYTSVSQMDDHPMTSLLRGTLEANHLSYNIHVNPVNDRGSANRQTLLYQGPPGSNSVVASTTVLLRDTDIPAESTGGCTLGKIDADQCGEEQFYVDNTEPDTDRFAVVTIRLEIWQG